MPAPAVLRPFLPRQPLTSSDRWVIALLWATGMAMGWSQSQASTLLPFTRLDLGVTEGGMSLILGLARLAAIGAVLLGMAADRIGRRRPLVIALTLLLLANGASALATGPLAYGLAQSIARIGGASVSALGVVVLAEVVSAGVRAYAISFFGAAASLGAGLSLLTLPLAESTEWGWRLPHGLPLILVLMIPSLWRRIPESPLLHRSLVRLPWGDLLRGERKRRFVLVSLAALLASAFSAVGLAFTTERLIGDLGFSPGAAVLITLLGGTVGGAGFFVGGRLADGWGRRPTAILALGLALAGGLALYRVTDPALVALTAAVSAFGSFALIPAGGAHRSELFPTSLRGASGSAANYLATVGSALGLLLSSLTIDRFGLPTTMTILGLGMVAAAFLTSRLPETLGADLTEV
ncbi:MAG TPA: MFS transporter [Acidimicrobiia bacterium]|nr:MFS transporter [Acidimicrobiia bacterium]